MVNSLSEFVIIHSRRDSALYQTDNADTSTLCFLTLLRIVGGVVNMVSKRGCTLIILNLMRNHANAWFLKNLHFVNMAAWLEFNGENTARNRSAAFSLV
jgi:hypothetical protein